MAGSKGKKKKTPSGLSMPRKGITTHSYAIATKYGWHFDDEGVTPPLGYDLSPQEFKRLSFSRKFKEMVLRMYMQTGMSIRETQAMFPGISKHRIQGWVKDRAHARVLKSEAQEMDAMAVGNLYKLLDSGDRQATFKYLDMRPQALQEYHAIDHSFKDGADKLSDGELERLIVEEIAMLHDLEIPQLSEGTGEITPESQQVTDEEREEILRKTFEEDSEDG